MNTAILAPVTATIDQVTPLYDYLLVRRLHDHEHTGLVIPSTMTLAASGKWVSAGDHGPRRGEVVAAGRGDKCLACDGEGWVVTPPPAEGEPCDCDACEVCCTRRGRVPMAVSVGDIILYPRFEANHVMLDGEQLTFVHEADVMAVLEAG